MARRAKIQTRKLEETSWLAQTLEDMRVVESERMEWRFPSARYHNLYTLKLIVNLADDPDNHSVYRENRDGKLWIVVCDIPDLSVKEGTDFSIDRMQCKLRGCQESYKYDNGHYIMSVLTTHDLNSCQINISDLMQVLRLGFCAYPERY